LGLALLYTCLDEELSESLPAALSVGVSSVYDMLYVYVQQPVVKVSLHIYRLKDQLSIDEVAYSALPSAETGAQHGAPSQAQQEAIASLLIQMYPGVTTTAAESSHALTIEDFNASNMVGASGVLVLLCLFRFLSNLCLHQPFCESLLT
jgi:hypothetical protein